MSDRQKVLYAVLASAFFHLIAGCVLAFWAVDHSAEVARALPDLGQLEVTIMPAKAKPTPPPAPKIAETILPASHAAKPVIDSDDLTRSTKAPAHAVFQSDANMLAASLLPATGNIPLPSEAGKERNFIGYKDQPSSFGKGAVPSRVPPSAARPAAPASPALPEQSPSAISRVVPVATPVPTPKPTPIPTPVPKAKPLSTPKPADNTAAYAMGQTTPIPTPAPAASPTPFDLARLNPSLMRGHADMHPMPPPPEQTRQQTRPAPEPSEREGIDKTGVNGGIANRGPNGVDAAESPYGKYMHQIKVMLNSRWRYYVDSQPDLTALGTVRIRFHIAKSGKVTDTRVLSNTSNEGLAALSIKAIMDCTLPPIPDDLAPMLDSGQLEIDNDFILYDPDR